jgi:mannose-6-phosphate isomerase
MLYPFKMAPVFKDCIWGGQNLKRLGKSVPDGRVAESWELSVMPGRESKISNGPLKGRSLADLIKKYGTLILGGKFSPDKINAGLPVLLKYIDASDKLSIQVHPNDEYASAHENGKMGKTEIWYIIDAKPGASVIHGFTEGYGKEEIYEAVLEGKHEGLYRRINVKKGDVVFVAPGTVHGMNGGLVVAEVQQHSDLTYRLYDYDRTDSAGNKRPLHVNKALDVLDYGNRQALYQGLTVNCGKICTKYLAMSEYFCVKQIEGRGIPVELTADGSFTAFMFIEGEAEIVSGNKKVQVCDLETVFIPAYMGSYEITGVFLALQIFVPESVADEYKSLIEKGFLNEDIINNVAGAENYKTDKTGDGSMS